MLYLEYEKCKRKRQRLLDEYKKLLREKEAIFTKTQPKAIRYDADRVQESHDGNKLENYILEMEQKRIDERLKEVQSYIEGLDKIAETLIVDMQTSNVKEDRFYVLRCVLGKKMSEIVAATNYSEPYIYKRLAIIKKNIEKNKRG